MNAVLGLLAEIAGIPPYVLAVELPRFSLPIPGLWLLLYTAGGLLRPK